MQPEIKDHSSTVQPSNLIPAQKPDDWRPQDFKKIRDDAIDRLKNAGKNKEKIQTEINNIVDDLQKEKSENLLDEKNPKRGRPKINE